MTAARSVALCAALLVLATACSGSASIGGLDQQEVLDEITALADETEPGGAG